MYEKSKYKNRKTTIGDIVFDSKKEAERYIILKEFEKRGAISDLRIQVKFELIPKCGKNRACSYYADFVYRDKDGNEIVEDVKGKRTDVYTLKKKLLMWRYGIEIKEV